MVCQVILVLRLFCCSLSAHFYRVDPQGTWNGGKYDESEALSHSYYL